MLSLEQTWEYHLDCQFFSLILKWLRTNQDFCHSNFIGSVKKYPSQPPQLTGLPWQKLQSGHIYTSKERPLLGEFILFREPVGVLSLQNLSC